MNKKGKRLLATSVVAALVLGMTAAPVSAAWEASGASWKYSQAGKYAANRWQKINGNFYYFDESATMVTGWISDKTGWYYCRPDGTMATGWTSVDENWYFFEADGHMKTGWVGNSYFCDASGKMVTGLAQINGVDYEFDAFGTKTNAVPVGYVAAAYTSSGASATIKDPVKDGSTAWVTIPEGKNAGEIGTILEKNGICRKADFLKALNAYQPTSETFQALAADPTLFYAFEGCLYPDTYNFYRYDSPANIVAALLKNFDSKLTDDLKTQMRAKNCDLKKLLTIASILQEEAAKPEDMAKVSAILWNRLAQPERYPTLGFNPTSEYVTAQILPHLAYGHAIDPNSYDTYKCKGLPAGPIDNPGMTAILAALNPETPFGYTFFCTDSMGKFYFANTNAEHEKNMETVKQINALLAASSEPKALS